MKNAFHLRGQEIEKRFAEEGLNTSEIFSNNFDLAREYTVRDLCRLFLSKKDKVRNSLHSLKSVDDEIYLKEIAALLGMDYDASRSVYIKETHQKRLSLGNEQRKRYLSSFDKGRINKKRSLEDEAEIFDSDNTVDKKVPKNSLNNQLDRQLKSGAIDLVLHKKIIRGMSSLSDKGIKHLLILISQEEHFVDKVLDVVKLVGDFNTIAKFLDGMDIKNITTMIHELLPKENAEIIDTVSVSALKKLFDRGGNSVVLLNTLLSYKQLTLLNEVETRKVVLFVEFMSPLAQLSYRGVTLFYKSNTLTTILNGLTVTTVSTLAQVSVLIGAKAIHTLWSEVETQKLIEIFNGFDGNFELLSTILQKVPAKKIVEIWNGAESGLIVSLWKDVKKADTTAAFLNAFEPEKIIEIYKTFQGDITLFVDLLSTVEIDRVIALFKNIDSKTLYSYLQLQGLQKLTPFFTDVNISFAIAILKDLPAGKLAEIVFDKFLSVLKYLDDSELVVDNLVTLLKTVKIQNLNVFFESIEPSTIQGALRTVNGIKLAKILDGLLVFQEKILDVFNQEELNSLFWLFNEVNSNTLVVVLNCVTFMSLGSILSEIDRGTLGNIMNRVDDDLLIDLFNNDLARGTLIKVLNEKKVDRFIALANKYATKGESREFINTLSKEKKLPRW